MSAGAPSPSQDAIIADVWRDQWGIPHIKAKSRADAFVALGFAHARDRLWQMEALLRRGAGRYAEWVGKSARAADILARQVDVAGASKRDFAVLSAEARAMLEAYASGVNAFIATGYRPIEYGLLETEPETWLPWHSIAVMRQIGFLMGSVWWKLGGLARCRSSARRRRQPAFRGHGQRTDVLAAGSRDWPFRAALDELRPGVEALLEVAPHVVGGAATIGRSARRAPPPASAVAGDPHRVLEMPNMYCAGPSCLRRIRRSASLFRACQAFRISATTARGVVRDPRFVDIHDLYVERFSDGCRSVLFRDAGAGAAAARGDRREGAKTRPFEVIETRHRPDDLGDPRQGLAWRCARCNSPN